MFKGISETTSPVIQEESETGNSNHPLVTMPSHDLVEVPENEGGGLTSPNLVHNINPGMSLASATNFARMQSFSHQERKESSSSSVTKMQGDQVVSSAQNSSSSASASSSAATGQMAIGQVSHQLLKLLIGHQVALYICLFG